jgi:hypothetical protein
VKWCCDDAKRDYKMGAPQGRIAGERGMNKNGRMKIEMFVLGVAY